MVSATAVSNDLSILPRFMLSANQLMSLQNLIAGAILILIGVEG